MSLGPLQLLIILVVFALLLRWIFGGRRIAESKYHQGQFHPENPEKYSGDINGIFYRSGWERDFCAFLDQSESIESWEYEPLTISYHPYGSAKFRRYTPDFKVVFNNGDTYLFEIKPAEQERDPVNQAKWEEARQYAKYQGWKFKVLNEHDLEKYGVM